LDSVLPVSPPWVLFPLVWFIVMAAFAAGSRAIARKRTSQERQTQVARYSNKLTSATATGLFVLIGFGITMSWNTFTAGQSAVDAQFVAADELIVASLDLENVQDKNRLLASVANYLDTTTEEDFTFFAQGNVFPAPSVDSFRELQQAASAAIEDPGTGQKIQISLIEDSVTNLAENRGELLSVSNRVLPPVMMALIMISTLFVAVFMGASLSDEERPWLLFGWVCVLTLALAVMIWISHPFTAPLGIDISSLSELADVARGFIEEPATGS